MRVWLPWKPTCLLLLIAVLRKEISGSSSMRCADLECHNDSPCRTVTNGNLSMAECVCQQGWIGETCQRQVHLKITSVSMTTVKMKVESDSLLTGSSDIHAGDVPTQHYNYTIHYWKNNQSTLCNIVTMVMTSTITVTGLLNNTEYTFCMRTDEAMLCNFDLVYYHDNVSYCTTARTSKTKVTSETNSVSVVVFYTVIVSCAVTVALSILTAVLIISIRKKYFSSLIGARNRKRRQTRSKNNSVVMDDTISQEMFLLTTPTTNQRMTINPPSSPGKPKNQLVNTRVRGFASFSAKDDHAIALSTVIEYGEEDGHSDDSFYDNQDDQQQTTFF